jgi:hypothetical protein
MDPQSAYPSDVMSPESLFLGWGIAVGVCFISDDDATISVPDVSDIPDGVGVPSDCFCFWWFWCFYRKVINL